MLNPDPFNRLDVAGAINHDFFTKSQGLKHFEDPKEFVIDKLLKLKLTWNSIVLKDSFKSYFTFMSSAPVLSACFEQIFDQK